MLDRSLRDLERHLAAFPPSERDRIALARGTVLELRAEGPVPFEPRGVAHAPPAPSSAVVAREVAYVASPLVPAVNAFDLRSGTRLWRHPLEGILVPDEGPRATWPTAEVAPADRGPLLLAPLPRALFGITLAGWVFLLEDASIEHNGAS